jgi:hypothetical protein
MDFDLDDDERSDLQSNSSSSFGRASSDDERSDLKSVSIKSGQSCEMIDGDSENESSENRDDFDRGDQDI